MFPAIKNIYRRQRFRVICSGIVLATNLVAVFVPLRHLEAQIEDLQPVFAAQQDKAVDLARYLEELCNDVRDDAT